jgi:uncharacterized protein YkwD
MGDSGESLRTRLRARWPAGGAGIAAAVFVAASLLAGGAGGVAHATIPDTVRVGDEPIVDPIGPLDAAPLGFTEPLPHKEAATVTTVTASWVPPPPPPPRRSGGASGGGGGGGSAVLTYTNAARAANGLGGLSWNGTLASRSCSWATHLASINSDLSVNPHSTFAGGFSQWGENVAYGSGPLSASSAVSLWMGSPGHRANILKPQYTMMGSCSATSATGHTYWVQQFGA